MPLLVDGYNLLYAFQQSRWGSDRVGRTALCRLLGDWTDSRSEPVTVVFDGAKPPDLLAKQLGDPRITVLYSGLRTADHVLVELIEGSTAPRRLRVVTGDHEIRAAAVRREAVAIQPAEFCAELCRPEVAEAGPPQGCERPEVAAGGDLEHWLGEFGYDPASEPGFEHP